MTVAATIESARFTRVPAGAESPKELFCGAASAHHKDKLNLLCAALQPVGHTYRHRRYRHRCSGARPSSISTPPGEAFLTKKGATCAVTRQQSDPCCSRVQIGCGGWDKQDLLGDSSSRHPIFALLKRLVSQHKHVSLRVHSLEYMIMLRH